MADKYIFKKLGYICLHILIIGILTTVATTVSLYHYGTSGDNLVRSFIDILQLTFIVIAATIWVVLVMWCTSEIIRYIAGRRTKKVIFRKVKYLK